MDLEWHYLKKMTGKSDRKKENASTYRPFIIIFNEDSKLSFVGF